MSSNNSTTGKPVRAAAYYRMSTDMQQHSIERQQSQVNPYLARTGYQLVREYRDEAISGAEFEKRTGFQQLLKDAQAGRFDVIVADEPSRLSRQDVITFIVQVVDPLRKAGVKTEFVSTGPIDWDSLAGILTGTFHQDKATDENKALARRILTRLADKANKAIWPGGIVPYGFRAIRVKDEDGSTYRKLVPGDPREVEVVRWIFDMVGNHGWSVGRVCLELNERGVKPPRGNGYGSNKDRGLWNRGTVRKILTNRKYVGDLVWNGISQAKYWIYRGGQVVELGRASTRSHRSEDTADMIVRTDVIPALVSRELFQRAQEVMARNRTETSPKKPGEARHLLTHMLVCGHCGRYMVGNTRNGKRTYICSSYQRLTRKACSYNSIQESVILDKIVATLEREYLNPDKLNELRQEMEDRLKQMVQSGEAGRLRKQVQALAGKIDRGHENLLLLPADRHPALLGKLRSWEQERDRLQEELARLEHGEQRIREVVRIAEGHLWRLRDGLTSREPEKMQSVIKEVCSKIELFFTHEPWGQDGKRMRSRFRKGVLHLWDDLVSSQLDTSQT